MSRHTADDVDYIAQALGTEGGHLSIGHYGATLHFGEIAVYRASTPTR